MISFPFLYMSTLIRYGVDGSAIIIKRETRSGELITPDYTASTAVIFEFTPEGSTQPIQLVARVQKIGSMLSEGKTVKIRYARSNPRIVKFEGE